MRRLRGVEMVTGLCAALAASSAWADSSAFVGRWHWNPAQSTMPPGEPAPNDLTAEFCQGGQQPPDLVGDDHHPAGPALC
jgi:hypothetical protein